MTSLASGERRRTRVLRGLLLALLILFVAIFAPLKHHLRAASLLWQLQSPAAEGWFVRNVAEKLARIDLNPVRTELRTIPAPTPLAARFYYPVGRGNAPTVIVLHGVHHLGIEEPRLVAFATALASHGFLAITPELNDLADYRITPQTIESIGECAHFVRQSSGKPATIIGLSFAGGLALMAAAEPRWRDDIGLILAVGAYDDLQRVLEYYATRPHDLAFRQASPGFPRMSTARWSPFTIIPKSFFHPATCPPPAPLFAICSGRTASARRPRPNSSARKAKHFFELLFQHHIDVLSPVLLRGIRKYHDVLAAISPHGHLAGLAGVGLSAARRGGQYRSSRRNRVARARHTSALLAHGANLSRHQPPRIQYIPDARRQAETCTLYVRLPRGRRISEAAPAGQDSLVRKSL